MRPCSLPASPRMSRSASIAGACRTSTRKAPPTFFLAGVYCHAGDGFGQMELTGRMPGGELADLFGPRLLRVDRFLRRLGFRRNAEQEAATVDPHTRAIATAYAAGVNAYL